MVTPVPNRAVEYSSKGSTSSLREYKLTPEELEEIRQKYPATKADKSFKKPIVQNVLTKEEKDMGGQRTSKEGPSCGLTKRLFLEQIAAGETVSSIEKAWGMKYNTLYNWVKNWDCRGITPDKAKEMLAMIGGESLLREKDSLPSVKPSEIDLLVLAKKEIAEVRAELQVLKAEYMVTEEELARTKMLFDDAYRRDLDSTAKIGEHLQAIQELREEVEHWKGEAQNTVALAGKANDQLTTELQVLRDELNWVITERDELTAENDGLYRRMIEAREEATQANDELDKLREMVDEEAKPASEIHLLDRSIADLTRAKWILNRLTAVGE